MRPNPKKTLFSVATDTCTLEQFGEKLAEFNKARMLNISRNALLGAFMAVSTQDELAGIFERASKQGLLGGDTETRKKRAAAAQALKNLDAESLDKLLAQLKAGKV